MSRLLLALVVALLPLDGYAHHGDKLWVGIYQKNEKLSAFIPHCGHDRWDHKHGSFFVIANPDVLELLEQGYRSKGDVLLKHVAVEGVFLDETKVGYDGVVFLSSAVEIDVGRSSKHGVHIPCT